MLALEGGGDGSEDAIVIGKTVVAKRNQAKPKSQVYY